MDLRRLPRTATRVAVEEQGEGAPVLLLHGQPGSRRDWDAVAGELAADAHVVRYDRPGYGESDGPALGIFANADVAAELLEDLALGERAIVAGHSWGGGVALALAARRPDLVAGLVLAASIGPRASVDRVDRVLASPIAGAALAAGLLRAGAKLIQVGPLRRRVSLPAAAAGRIAHELSAPGARAAFVAEQRALVREIDALDDTLAEVRVPTRVLAGDRDRLLPVGVARELTERLAEATLAPVPRAGHVLPHEAPDAVAGAVRDLLAS